MPTSKSEKPWYKRAFEYVTDKWTKFNKKVWKGASPWYNPLNIVRAAVSLVSTAVLGAAGFVIGAATCIAGFLKGVFKEILWEGVVKGFFIGCLFGKLEINGKPVSRVEALIHTIGSIVKGGLRAALNILGLVGLGAGVVAVAGVTVGTGGLAPLIAVPLIGLGVLGVNETHTEVDNLFSKNKQPDYPKKDNQRSQSVTNASTPKPPARAQQQPNPLQPKPPQRSRPGDAGAGPTRRMQPSPGFQQPRPPHAAQHQQRHQPPQQQQQFQMPPQHQTHAQQHQQSYQQPQPYQQSQQQFQQVLPYQPLHQAPQYVYAQQPIQPQYHQQQPQPPYPYYQAAPQQQPHLQYHTRYPYPLPPYQQPLSQQMPPLSQPPYYYQPQQQPGRANATYNTPDLASQLQGLNKSFSAQAAHHRGSGQLTPGHDRHSQEANAAFSKTRHAGTQEAADAQHHTNPNASPPPSQRRPHRPSPGRDND